MFPSPYVPQSLCSPLYVISPYVSHVPQSLCYPEMFPSPVAPQTYITQPLCSPVPMFPIFPSPYVPPTSSPVPMFPSPIPQKCFPFPMFPKHVPQSLCSPVPMFPKHVPRCLCSPVPMFPQLVSPVPVFPIPYFPWHSPIPYVRSIYNPQKCFQSDVPQRCHLVPILHSLVPMFSRFVASQSFCSPVTRRLQLLVSSIQSIPKFPAHSLKLVQPWG